MTKIEKVEMRLEQARKKRDEYATKAKELEKELDALHALEWVAFAKKHSLDSKGGLSLMDSLVEQHKSRTISEALADEEFEDIARKGGDLSA